MNEQYLVSVILPVYNAEKYISEAIWSILNQTHKNFELIIIDDGSTDRSLEIIETIIDPRIILITRENRGLIKTLNQAISLAKGDFIARMDADDISHPRRLELQLNFLLQHPDVGVIGSYVECVDENGVLLCIRKPPRLNYFLKGMCLFGVPFSHPSIMVNYKLIGEEYYYDEKYVHAEDFELWVRLSKNFKFGLVAECLLKYRILNSSVSSLYKEGQDDMHKRIVYFYFIRNKQKLSFEDFSKIYSQESFCDFFFRIILNQNSFAKIPFQVIYLARKILKRNGFVRHV
jgi:glycosyltransferase involved in cell wall biosynthesis